MHLNKILFYLTSSYLQNRTLLLRQTVRTEKIEIRKGMHMYYKKLLKMMPDKVTREMLKRYAEIERKIIKKHANMSQIFVF